jgi:hypothetical protein
MYDTAAINTLTGLSGADWSNLDQLDLAELRIRGDESNPLASLALSLVRTAQFDRLDRRSLR